jgi:hypothetical protein
MPEPFDEFETEQGGLVVMSASEKDFRTGNKPGTGKHDFNPTIQGKFVEDTPFDKFYDWFPLSGSCETNSPYFHVECNPKPKFTIRVGSLKLGESNAKLRIDKKSFDAGVAPTMEEGQFLSNTLFWIITQDLLEVKPKILDLESGLIEWYKNWQGATTEDAAFLVKDCLKSKKVDLDFFRYPPTVPDGSAGFTIFAAYRLPSQSGNYTLSKITVPPR